VDRRVAFGATGHLSDERFLNSTKFGLLMRSAERRLVRFPLPIVVLRTLSAITAALLAVDAYVHLRDAHLYDFATGGNITQGNLFRVQASVAIVVAIALLLWPRWLSWAVAVLVAGTAAGAVLLYRYVDVGRLGPLPNMYEPTWALPDKRLSAFAECAAFLTASAGLGLALYIRQRTAGAASAARHQRADQRSGVGTPS
jgi:hypothetical protein